MKLRLTETMLRLRLTQRDVERFHREGALAATTRFGSGAVLTFALEASSDAETVSARFEPPRLTVVVPEALAHRWATTDEAGFEAEQPTGEGPPLTLLIEKDFQCLHKPSAARDADAFPHPLQES